MASVHHEHRRRHEQNINKSIHQQIKHIMNHIKQNSSQECSQGPIHVINISFHIITECKLNPYDYFNQFSRSISQSSTLFYDENYQKINPEGMYLLTTQGICDEATGNITSIEKKAKAFPLRFGKTQIPVLASSAQPRTASPNH